MATASLIDKALGASISTNSGVESVQKTILTGRFLDQYGLPVALYHRSLATLQHRLEMLDTQVRPTTQAASTSEGAVDGPSRLALDDQLYEAAQEYFGSAREFYADEGQRMANSVKSYFKAIFGSDNYVEQNVIGRGASAPKLSSAHSSDRSKGGGKARKGDVRVDAVWKSTYPYVFLEVKNEYGIGGNASLQCAKDYRKACKDYAGKVRSHPFFPLFFPSVLMLEILPRPPSCPPSLSVSWATSLRSRRLYT
jgi:hypothetical protein